MINVGNYAECEKLQEVSAVKYWDKLYNKVIKSISPDALLAMPLHLRNPIVYIKQYLDQCNFYTSKEGVFFSELIAINCDIKNLLANVEVFNTNLPFQQSRRTFYSLLVILSGLADKDLQMLKEFIEQYHDKYKIDTNMNFNFIL